MSIYNGNLFATDASLIALTKDELENSYEKLQSRLRLYRILKNTKPYTFHFVPSWTIPALAALFAAIFFIPALQTKNESPLIMPIETMRYTNPPRSPGVIVDGNINDSTLSSLLADIRDFSSEDKTYTGEALPYFPEIDVFKPDFPDHGIHVLNFSATLLPAQAALFTLAELSFPATTGSGM